MAIKKLSPLESQGVLKSIAESLKDQGQLEKFISKSCPEAQRPENQLLDDNDSMPLDVKAQHLIEVPFITGAERLKKIRESFGYNTENIISPNKPVESMRKRSTTSSVSHTSQNADLDLLYYSDDLCDDRYI